MSANTIYYGVTYMILLKVPHKFKNVCLIASFRKYLLSKFKV